MGGDNQGTLTHLFNAQQVKMGIKYTKKDEIVTSSLSLNIAVALIHTSASMK